MESFGSETLAGLLAELTASQGLTYDWDTGADNDAIPDSLFLPLSYLLAVDIAAHYEIAPRDSRAAMIGRLRVQEFPDDREDSRDLDEDGTVDEAEAAAAQRAAFY